MKKLALLLLLSAGCIFAQSTAPTRTVDADPSGACVAKIENQFNERNGKYWGCVDSTGIGFGTWTWINQGTAAAFPSTSNLIKGDGAGGGAAATPGTDYVVPSGTVAAASALAANPANCASAGTFPNGIAANGTPENCTRLPQQFFGTAAPGSVSGNLPGDRFSDTTNHNDYWCSAPSGTAAPACTSVTTGGWALANGGAGGGVVLDVTAGTGASVGGTTAHPVVNVDPTVVPFLTSGNVASGPNNMSQQIVTKATAYTTTTADWGVLGDTSGGAFTISLPASPTTGLVQWFKNLSTSLLTISGNGKNIEGAATSTLLATTNNSMGVQYDGTQWRILWQPSTGGTTVSANGPYLQIGSTNYIAPFMHVVTVPPTLTFQNTQGSSAQTVNADGSVTFTAAPVSGDNFVLLGTSMGANTTLTVALNCSQWDQGSNSNNCGVAFRESGTGKMSTITLSGNGAGSGMSVSIVHYTNQTTYAGSFLVAGQNATSAYCNICYFQIQQTGGNVKYRLSPDGIDYPIEASEAQTTPFTTAADSWGAVLNSNNASFPIVSHILSYKQQ